MNETQTIPQFSIQAPVGKIYARMADAMAEINAIGKDSRNEKQGFKFRGIDAVMNELHAILQKNRIFILQDLLEATHENKTTKSGTEMTHHFNRIKYTFTTDDGSSVAVTVMGESADSGDKGANKCMAVALKYALTQVFCIPTEDQGEPKDPDAQSHEFAAIREKRNEAQKIKDDAEGVPTVPASWRMHEVHFDFPKAKKKTKGVRLIDLDATQLKWFQEKWKPKEWNGKFNDKDLALRAALDASMKSSDEGIQHDPAEGPSIPPKSPEPEIPDTWQQCPVHLDGFFEGTMLGDLTHEKRMSLYNDYRNNKNTTDPRDVFLKLSLMAWKKEVDANI